MFEDTTDKDKNQLREVRAMDRLSVLNRIEDMKDVYDHVDRFDPAPRMLADLKAVLKDAELLADMTIDRTSIKVSELWPFNDRNYPQLQTTLPAAIRHVVLHVTKDAGRMAGAVEPEDHGKTVDYRQLIRSSRNMLVNALRLCSLLEVKPTDLLEDYYMEMTTINPSQANLSNL